MTPTPKPSWINDDPDSEDYRYDGIVRSFGYTVEARKEFGEYQGDLAYVLRDGEHIGYVVIGYGSCCGCDAYEDALPEGHWSCEFGDDPCLCDWTGIVALRDELLGAVRWSRPADADPANEWWTHETEMFKWLSAAYDAIAAAREEGGAK